MSLGIVSPSSGKSKAYGGLVILRDGNLIFPGKPFLLLLIVALPFGIFTLVVVGIVLFVQRLTRINVRSLGLKICVLGKILLLESAVIRE